MKLLLRHTLWLWAAALLCLAAPASRAQESRAEESSDIQVPHTENPYISAVATLYKQGRYEEARSILEKALDSKSNGPEEVLWLKLMQGVLLAELAQGKALDSFKEALALDKDAKLPVQGSRRLRKLFEQARGTLGLPADKDLLAQELEPVPVALGAKGPPPRRYGLSVGVRGEVDVLWQGVTPAVSLAYTREKLGGALTVLEQESPGLRLEGQYHPFTLGWVRPYARLGATAFFAELDARGWRTIFGGVGGRAALGVDVQWTSRLFAFADVSYEHFLTGGEHYRSQSVLFSLGVGLFS